MKNYSTAPLPFVGQKRNFIKVFKTELFKKEPPKIYVDLFGGSGLLSRVAKDTHPTSKVIYNDYDNYRRRLKSIKTTNAILKDLRPLVAHIQRKTKIDSATKEKIIERISKEKGFVDYITISASLLFSMKYVLSLEELKRETFYNRVRITPIPSAEDYLKDLEVVSLDYKQLFKMYKDCKGVIFLIDPPYLSTDCSTYASDNYWKLKDYLDVLKLLNNQNYFYFTSNKSSIIELCEWIGDNTGAVNPFDKAEIKTHFTTMNQSSSYTDIMLFKWNKTTT
jgi:adenine-specific DNA methylase